MEPIKDFSYGVLLVHKAEKENLFLLVQHSAGHWSFPRGHKEDDESDIETAKREVFEETQFTEEDYTLIDTKPMFFYQHIFEGEDDKKYDKKNSFFLLFVGTKIFKNKKPKPLKQFSHEVLDLRWVNYEEAKKLINFEPTNKMLEELNYYLK